MQKVRIHIFILRLSVRVFRGQGREKADFSQRESLGRLDSFPKQPGPIVKKIFTTAKNIYTAS
jgi:hypothetical protein